MNRRASCGFV